MKKAQIYWFWLPAMTTAHTSKYKRFVAKADYDRAIERIKELEAQLNSKGTLV